jgi:hypothetical protein
LKNSQETDYRSGKLKIWKLYLIDMTQLSLRIRTALKAIKRESDNLKKGRK